ncbi:MAG: SRPBCC domain-containing protein [Candidatus Methanoperedens sp.]|nr:SRPBCC domain-containing protein [Candidatus Methanoperedens sp.]
MELYTEIQINAPPERIWRILTDFAGFPQWNPFIRRASGKPENGEKLEVYLQPEGAGGMTVRPIVLKSEPGRELRWRGHLLLPGLFDGEHIFIIEPLVAGGVRFIQREIFTGLFVPFLAHKLNTETRRGFEDMNHALKLLAEGEN